MKLHPQLGGGIAMKHRRLFILVCVAGFSMLSACSLFGKGPDHHTVVDYDSLEPTIGHGADYDETKRTGRTDQRHDGAESTPQD